MDDYYERIRKLPFYNEGSDPILPNSAFSITGVYEDGNGDIMMAGTALSGAGNEDPNVIAFNILNKVLPGTAGECVLRGPHYIYASTEDASSENTIGVRSLIRPINSAASTAGKKWVTHPCGGWPVMAMDGSDIVIVGDWWNQCDTTTTTSTSTSTSTTTTPTTTTPTTTTPTTTTPTTTATTTPTTPATSASTATSGTSLTTGSTSASTGSSSSTTQTTVTTGTTASGSSTTHYLCCERYESDDPLGVIQFVDTTCFDCDATMSWNTSTGQWEGNCGWSDEFITVQVNFEVYCLDGDFYLNVSWDGCSGGSESDLLGDLTVVSPSEDPCCGTVDWDIPFDPDCCQIDPGGDTIPIRLIMDCTGIL